MPAPLKSYIDRVLNVLADIDELGEDKKGIYKELASDGYDRTVVSQVVGHLRKKAAKPGKFAEQSALFDLYLTEYEGVGTRVATHAAREDDVAHDADGVIIENDETPDVAKTISAVQDGAGPAEVHTLGQAGSTPAPATSSAPRADTDQGASGEGDTPDLAATPSARVDADAAVDRSGQGVSSSLAQSAPVANSNKRLTFNDPAHRDCLDPAMCGGFSNLKLCQRCREASEMGQVA